jgi:hypothetical protein
MFPISSCLFLLLHSPHRLNPLPLLSHSQETFRRRLDLYNDNTFPLLKYYGDSAPSIVHILKGETSDEIWPELDEVIKEVMGEHTA